MNDLDRWHNGNQHYLAAALEWLRLRLKSLAAQDTAVPAAMSPPEPRKKSCFFSFFRRSEEPESTTVATKHIQRVTEAHIKVAEKKMQEAEAMEPPPALLILAKRLGLSRFEREVMLLCAAMELDTRTAFLCASAQNDHIRAYPTFALALALFEDPAWDILSPERPLRHWRLIEINQSGAQSLTGSPLRADERIVNYIKGLNYLDDRLAPLLVPLDIADAEPELPPSQQGAADSIVGRLRGCPPGTGSSLVQLVGPDPVSKQLVARQAASELGLHLYRLPAELLPQHAGELETLVRLWQRESILLPICLFLDAHDAEGTVPSDGGSSQTSTPIHRFLARDPGLVFLGSREVQPGLGLGRNGITLDVGRPTPAEQQAAWRKALGEEAGDRPELLAGQFNLNLSAIRQIAGPVIAGKQSNESASDMHERLWNACLSRTRPRLDRLAQRIETKATRKDLVLPEEPRSLLCEIVAQVRQRSMVYDAWGFRRTMNRGFGISALFAGESGTGKTMAAEVIANELRLNLYRIDLSAVVSKYIGETEKNLRRVFDAAEDGGAILFFDEADALFGKRSEVKDSHDRYANIEINYLLQRMEAFRGLAILATNMKSALDQAFMRRLRFIVNFPFPGVKERQLIWENVFPKTDESRGIAGTPTVELDYGHLARLNLTGGSIHNIALNAAFLAAWAGTPVTMPLIFDAARTEFRKIEKPVNEADFRYIKPVGVMA